MNHDITEIKALNFEHQIDLMWCNGNTEPMNQLLKMIEIPYDRSDLMDYGWLLSDSFIDNWGVDETIKRMKSFIPLDKDNLNTDSSQGQTCLNKKCSFWHSDREPSCYTVYSDCWVDIHIYVYIAIAIGGLSALKELRDKWDIDTEVLYQYYENKKGLYEKELYEMNLPIESVVKKHLHQIGDDNMSKPFWVALSELKIEDELSVFWTENTMYISDENNGQATTNVSLFQAYKFAILINATYFDYTASDEEVKELSEQLLDLIDEDKRAINVWNYIDDIQKDFFKLTGRWIGLDDKRHIVCCMTEMEDGYDLLCGFGSASYIAKMLWDYIKGNDKAHIPKCNNKAINNLADKHLQTDEYDILKFAEELHKEAKFTHEIEVNGALWVNSAKYEYVDKIIIGYDDIDIYWKDKMIGCIARDNLQTMVETNYEENVTTDLIDNLIYLFDIRKVGDF